MKKLLQKLLAVSCWLLIKKYMKGKFEMDISMVLVECAECSIPFAISAKFRKQRETDHKTFYCPIGHSNYFPQKSDEEILKEKIKGKERELEEKARQLQSSRQALREYEIAECERVRLFLKSFTKGTKTVPVAVVAEYFKMKSRDVMRVVRKLGLQCKRSADKKYQIILKEK